jgi:hypothetical protein
VFKIFVTLVIKNSYALYKIVLLVGAIQRKAVAISWPVVLKIKYNADCKLFIV